MSANSKIEWTDATWNPVRARLPEHIGRLATAEDDVTEEKIGTHCEHVSEGCRNCYAETFNRRGLPNAGTGLDYKPGHRDRLEHFLDEKMLLAPLRRKKPTRYFLSSLTDVFGAWVTDDMLDRLFAVMALCPQHVFQVLTKRPERAREYLTGPATPSSIMAALVDVLPGSSRIEQNSIAAAHWRIQDDWHIGLGNVWLGTSVEDQAAADARIPHLLATPAAVRFLSCEPLLGRVRLFGFSEDRKQIWNWLTGENGTMHFGGRDFDLGPKIDWVIVGGESGLGARPMHPDWARSLRDQCAAAGVPFFFKQWGLFTPLLSALPVEGSCSSDNVAWPDGTLGRGHSDDRGGAGQWLYRAQKSLAGRLLDGIEHNGMPS